MIQWFRKYINRIRERRKQKKIKCDYEKAVKHAVFALAYWKDCEGKSELHIQATGTNVYVRLGRLKNDPTT